MKNQYPPNDGQEPAAADEARAAEEAMELDESDVAAAETSSPQRDEVSELNERVLRLAAELENTRRRAEREKIDAGRYAIAAFARDLLGVLDAFERALALAPAERATASLDALWSILEGLRLSESNMIAVLERHGVRRINPKGQKFDPNLHQAVAQASGDAPAGHVLEVAQPGFVIGDRTLRAAMVVVSTGPSSQGGSGGSDELPAGAALDTTA